MDKETTILIDALKNIASYGDSRACPHGCDAPDVAIKALVDYGNEKYKEHSNAIMVEFDGKWYKVPVKNIRFVRDFLSNFGKEVNIED
jgi:hypothetical protein